MRRERPTPGWKPRNPLAQLFVNPRAPSVPATLDLDLEAYYTGCALVGLLSSQGAEPDPEWVSEWAIRQGKNTASKVRARRDARRKRQR